MLIYLFIRNFVVAILCAYLAEERGVFFYTLYFMLDSYRFLYKGKNHGQIILFYMVSCAVNIIYAQYIIESNFNFLINGSVKTVLCGVLLTVFTVMMVLYGWVVSLVAKDLKFKK